MIQPGTPIHMLDTPCSIVDMDIMEANIQRWQAAISKNGVKLRPHVKTHKIPAFAQKQIAAGAHGITVAKISEAEIFAENGCPDIFVAYPIIGAEKWQRVAALTPRCTLTVGLDSEVGAQGLNAAALAAGVKIRVRVEINLGMNRCGVVPESAENLCALVEKLPGLELDGIYTYRSTHFAGAGQRSIAEIGREEGVLMAELAEELRHVGLSIREVSVGSTPTGRHAAQVDGVTEARPGTYIFGDYMTAERGLIGYDEIALSILCTVVSRPTPLRATVDGGSKTFSGDVFPGNLQLRGYAKAADRDAYVEALSEEHGITRLGTGVDAKVGEKIAFYPIHVCTTVNLTDELIGVRDGVVEAVYPVAARGKRA